MVHTLVALSLSLWLNSCQPRIETPTHIVSDTIKPRGVNTLALIGNINRFEKEIKAFEKIDSTQQNLENATLFLGSSSIRLWKNCVGLCDNSAINRGFGGATIAEINHYYPRIVSKYHLQKVVFYCGENDLSHKAASVDSVFSDFQKFALRLKKDYPNIKFVYLSIKNSPSRMAFAPKFEDMNERVKTWASQDSNFSYVDFNTPLLNASGAPDSVYFRKDMLHLNELGYAKWEDAIRPNLHSKK